MSKVTKPLAWCWSFFNRKEEVDGKGKLIFVGYCKFSNADYTGKPSRMEEHLKNCNKFGTDARKEIDRLSKKPVARRSRSMSPTSKKPKISESAESPRASSGNLKHYFDSTSKDDQEKIDILLTRNEGRYSLSTDVQFYLVITTNKLQLRQATWPSIQVDGIYKLVTLCYPLLVAGLSDANKVFYATYVAISSHQDT